MYNGTLCGVGPSIEEGFYYDLALPTSISNEDLPKIEEEMNRIVKENLKITHEYVSLDDAKEEFERCIENYGTK